MLKFNIKNTRTTTMAHSGVFIVHFEHILRIVPVFFAVDFEQVNTD